MKHLNKIALPLALLALWAINQPWLEMVYDSNANNQQLAFSGAQLNSALTPTLLALAVSLIVSMFMRGVLARKLLSLFVAILAGVFVFLIFTVQQAGVQAAAGLLAEISGIAGGGQLALVVSAQQSLWPLLAGVCAVSILCSALVSLVLRTPSKSLPNRSSRFERMATATAGTSGLAPDRISDWDALSQDTDPTL